MAAPLIAAAIGAPIVGGLIGSQQAEKDRRATNRLNREQLARLDALNLPQYQQLGAMDFQTYGGLQDYNPALQSEILADQSEMQGIALDPALREAQMQALLKMQDVADDGMTDQDRYALSKIEGEQMRASRGQRGALDTQMRRRGMSGSGMDLIAQMQANQDAASQAAEQQMAVNAQAQQRALAAIEAQSQMAAGLRGQDFSEAERIAQAQDAINQFNTAHRRDVAGQNVTLQNQAQLANRDFAQQRIDQANDQNMFNNYSRVMDNNNLRNQQFQNEFQRASGQAGALGNLAQSHNQQANRTQQMWGGIGQGVGQGALAYGSYGGKQKQPASKPEPMVMNYQSGNTGQKIV